MLNESELSELIQDQIIRDAKGQWARLSFLSKQLDGLVAKTWTPPDMDDEYKDFLRKSRSPLLDFAAKCIAQGLAIDGHSDPEVWDRVWNGSGMDGRQSALNYETVAYGYGYVLAFPGDPDGLVSRPLSAMTTFSVNEDPWDDDPQYVLHCVKHNPAQPDSELWRLFDSEAMYSFRGRPDRPRDVKITEHDLGVNPVTVIRSEFAYDGFPRSVVEPGIPAYKRVVDATFSVKMLERYGAFPQKYQSGGQIATDEQGNALIRPSADSILHSDEFDTKFGAFPAADIEKATAAVDHHMQQLAAILNLPPHYLLGKVVNLSSDALAATETSWLRLITRLQGSMEDGYEAHLRKGAAILGMTDAAQDLTSEVHWRDTSVRSLAQVADAAQKLDAMGADRELLFQMIPGWSKQDAQIATRVALTRDKTNPLRGDAVTATADSLDESTD